MGNTPGWRPRLHDKYTAPISGDTFAVLNRAYVFEELQKGRLAPEWSSLLAEILDEVRVGRMKGPFEARRIGHEGAWQ